MKIAAPKNEKITIREIIQSDLKRAKKFQDFINSLTAEDAQILFNEKATIEEEKQFLKNALSATKKKSEIYLVAEFAEKIIGAASIKKDKWRRNHIGKFGIAIRGGYRGMGLGKRMMSEVINLAAKKLKPKPKIIQLDVFVNNKPAINLYKKMGFKIVARIPRQVQYKNKLLDEFVMLKYLQK